MAAATLKRSWASDLSTATLYELLKLRIEVFVVEQHAAYPELDGRDLELETRHFWLEDGDRVIATLRLLEDHDDGKKFRIGRVCTAKDMRGAGHTTRLVHAALAEVGDTPCRIDAQSYLIDLYTKFGFEVSGPEYTDPDGIPHVPMRRGE